MNLQDIKKLLQEELKPIKEKVARIDKIEKKMATKEEIDKIEKKMATKEDLNQLAERVTEDIIEVIKDTFEFVASKKDLLKLEKRIETLEQN